MLMMMTILTACAIAPPAPPPALPLPRPTTAPARVDDRAVAWLREADRRARAMPSGEQRDWLLGSIAKLHARARDVDGALAVAAAVERSNLRIYALEGACRSLVVAGDAAGARRVLDAMVAFACSPGGREAYHFTDGH